MKKNINYKKYEDEVLGFCVGFYTRYRYILPKEGQKTLSFINKMAKERLSSKLSKETNLYRSRINKDIQHSSVPFPINEMGIPPSEKAEPGRVSPEGLPILYCASNEITAISEVRPWVGANVTVARIALKFDLKIIDLTKTISNEYKNTKSSAYEDMLNWMFKTPRSPSEKTKYIPTQYLAENFKNLGYHGIKYSSGLSASGYNVAIFNQYMVDVVESYVKKVVGVEYKTN